MTVLAASSPNALWYFTRAAGAVTIVLLTASIVLGILNTVRWSHPPQWPRFVIDAIHRNISLLVLAVLAIHVLTAVIDTFAPISIVDVFIPFVSKYRPIWLGLGAIALDLLVALAVTSVLRRRVGLRAWRAIHWAAYACWPLALVHGLGTGTDAKLKWMLALTVICVASVIVALAWRIWQDESASAAVRRVALGATVAAPVALAVFLAVGPLASGWARRAGTPASLLAKVAPTSASAPAPAASSSSSSSLSVPFQAQVSGTVSQSTSGGNAVVQITTTMSGGATGTFAATITGAPAAGGGVSMTSSNVTVGTQGSPGLYRGRIVALQGSSFTASMSDASGKAVRLQANLQIDGSGTVTGTVSAS